MDAVGCSPPSPPLWGPPFLQKSLLWPHPLHLNQLTATCCCLVSHSVNEEPGKALGGGTCLPWKHPHPISLHWGNWAPRLCQWVHFPTRFQFSVGSGSQCIGFRSPAGSGPELLWVPHRFRYPKALGPRWVLVPLGSGPRSALSPRSSIHCLGSQGRRAGMLCWAMEIPAASAPIPLNGRPTPQRPHPTSLPLCVPSVPPITAVCPS